MGRLANVVALRMIRTLVRLGWTVDRRGQPPRPGQTGTPSDAQDLTASRVKVPRKPATVNPQKNSPALGATLAYLGIDRMLGLLHGAQGCSTFIRLQLSRHFLVERRSRDRRGEGSPEIR